MIGQNLKAEKVMITGTNVQRNYADWGCREITITAHVTFTISSNIKGFPIPPSILLDRYTINHADNRSSSNPQPGSGLGIRAWKLALFITDLFQGGDKPHLSDHLLLTAVRVITKLAFVGYYRITID